MARVASTVPISPADWFWLFLCASFATAGHYTMTLAFRAAPLAVTQPVGFLQLVLLSSRTNLAKDQAEHEPEFLTPEKEQLQRLCGCNELGKSDAVTSSE